MPHTLRDRARNDEGVGLIEILVVILIVAILAAIALVAFLNQREKAQDSEAKSAVRTAQTALETYYTDNQSYKPGTKTLADVKTDIVGIEPALGNASGLTVEAADATTYTVSTESKGKSVNVFKIASANGVVTRTCGTKADFSKKGQGGCPSTGSW